MATPLPTLDIIIVNWNTGPMLGSCLESIRTADQTGFRLREIVVVDNASTDGSAETAAGGLPVRLVRNPVNRGFAAACNQAALHSPADYLLFLNPDTQLTRSALRVPIGFLERGDTHRVGLLGIQLLDSGGRVSRSCARFLTPGMILRKMVGWEDHIMKDWDHRESREVDHVTGACLFVRRGVFEELGGFDERFFVYLEDLDLSLRAKQAGWHSMYLADATAYHVGGGSSDAIRGRRLYYALHSRVLYAYKHFPWSVATLVTLATAAPEFLTRLVRALARRSLTEARDTMHAYALLWRALPTITRPRPHAG